MITAIPNASVVRTGPRNKPAAAISLISPPPNAPGYANVITVIGRLTQSPPASLAPAGSFIPQKKEQTARTAIAAVRQSGIFPVLLSNIPAAASRPKKQIQLRISVTGNEYPFPGCQPVICGMVHDC